MIPQLAVIFGLVCPNITLINKTSEWNLQDSEAYTEAKKRCKELYKRSPCLKKFSKMEDGVYRAICGAPK